jgi:predicted metal-dependent hydrolase
MSDPHYETEYLQGIEHFNAHEFFEAHEVWEDIWARTSGRDQLFYKGLIHAAVALHHFGNRNLRGARKVWGSCRQYLTPYAPNHLGLDVESFLAEMSDCFVDLEVLDTVPGSVDLDESKIPHLVVEPAPSAAGD